MSRLLTGVPDVGEAPTEVMWIGAGERQRGRRRVVRSRIRVDA